MLFYYISAIFMRDILRPHTVPLPPPGRGPAVSAKTPSPAGGMSAGRDRAACLPAFFLSSRSGPGRVRFPYAHFLLPLPYSARSRFFSARPLQSGRDVLRPSINFS